MFVSCETGDLALGMNDSGLHGCIPSGQLPDAVDRSLSLPRTGFVSVPARNASLAGRRLRIGDIERAFSHSGTVRLESA